MASSEKAVNSVVMEKLRLVGEPLRKFEAQILLQLNWPQQKTKIKFGGKQMPNKHDVRRVDV